MALPDQVRRSVERAQELFDQVNAPPAEPTPPGEQQVTQDPPVDPPAEAQQVPAVPDPAPAPAPAQQEDFEQKYKTLQGIHAVQRREYEQRLARMEDELRTLKAAPAPAPAPAPAAAPTSRITDKDVETYGPELLDVIERKADERAERIIAQKLAELQPKLDQTQAQVAEFGQQVYKTNEERFYGELETQVPDWKVINQDTRFFDWLDEVDPMSGVTRKVYLDRAGSTLDHAQAAVLFNAFKASVGLNKPAAPAPAPAARLSPSPRTASAASAPAHSAPVTTVSRSEISAHYGRGARDPSYPRSPEHAAMEARIQAALASNQVTEA